MYNIHVPLILIRDYARTFRIFIDDLRSWLHTFRIRNYLTIFYVHTIGKRDYTRNQIVSTHDTQSSVHELHIFATLASLCYSTNNEFYHIV